MSMYLCTVCNINFQSYETYKLHVRYVHNIKQSQTNETLKSKVLSIRLDPVTQEYLTKISRFLNPEKPLPVSSTIKVLIMKFYYDNILPTELNSDKK